MRFFFFSGRTGPALHPGKKAHPGPRPSGGPTAASAGGQDLIIVLDSYCRYSKLPRPQWPKGAQVHYLGAHQAEVS